MGARIARLLIHAILCACVVFFPRRGGCAQSIALSRIAAAGNAKMLTNNCFGAEGARFLFRENSRIFTFNGIRMPLGFAATGAGGKIFLEQSDYGCHVLPLLRLEKLHPGRLRTVAIDAGHGGADEGTVSKCGTLREKDLAMDIARRLAKLLSAAGYRTVLTRNGDRKIPLAERTRVANRAGADLFLSIHLNSAPTADASGIEVFVLTPASQASSYQQASHAVRGKSAGNDFDALNIVLGYHLQSCAVAATSAVDRGVKHDRFAVLDGLKCPGALIECGFLSNRSESKKLASAEYRDKLARSMCEAVRRFAGEVPNR
jgi:N-acetylmuramoyl-L-alanine amidase